MCFAAEILLTGLIFGPPVVRTSCITTSEELTSSWDLTRLPAVYCAWPNDSRILQTPPQSRWLPFKENALVLLKQIILILLTTSNRRVTAWKQTTRSFSPSNGSISHGLSSDSLVPWRDRTLTQVHNCWHILCLISEWCLFRKTEWWVVIMRCGQAILALVDWILLCWRTSQSILYEHNDQRWVTSLGSSCYEWPPPSFRATVATGRERSLTE